MDKTKEFLIKRLLKEGKITEDDAIVLKREEKVIEKQIEFLTPPQENPFLKKPFNPLRQPYEKTDWITAELNNRQRIADNCGCNPANGGSGMCGCTLTSPIITC